MFSLPRLLTHSSHPPLHKDIVLVIDRSGSMNNKDRMNKARVAASWVINTMSYVDYGNLVSYFLSRNPAHTYPPPPPPPPPPPLRVVCFPLSSVLLLTCLPFLCLLPTRSPSFAWLRACAHFHATALTPLVQVTFGTDAAAMVEDLVPMKMSNRVRMKNYLGGTGAFGGTRIDKGFEKAFEVLANGKKNGATANCEKVILFLTDGVNTGEDPAEKVKAMNKDVGARIFTYHFGASTDTKGKDLMRRIACENAGVYFSVSEGANLKLIMASYFTYLAIGIIPKDKSKTGGIVWAERFEDGQGTGQLEAACAPMYDRSGASPALYGVHCLSISAPTVEAWGDGQKVLDLNFQAAKTCPESDLSDEVVGQIRAGIGLESVCPAAGFPPTVAEVVVPKAQFNEEEIGGIAVASLFLCLLILSAVFLRVKKPGFIYHHLWMIFVIFSMLVGIAAIALMSHQAGKDGLIKQIEALITKSTENAERAFQGALDIPVKSAWHGVNAIRRDEVKIGHKDQPTRMNSALQYLRNVGTIFKSARNTGQFVGSLNLKGGVTFYWADASKSPSTDAFGNPTESKYVVMDETTVNPLGKRCRCEDYDPKGYNPRTKKLSGWCKEELQCGFNPAKRGWFIKARALGEGKVSFSDPYSDWTTKDMIISVSILIVDPHDPDIIHVVAVDFSLSNFSPILETLRNATFEAVGVVQEDCEKKGNTDVDIMFALPDGTVLGSTDRSVMKNVAATSGDYRTDPSIDLVLSTMTKNPNSTTFLSLTDQSGDPNDPRKDPNKIISAKSFGANYFGRDGYMLVIIPTKFYFGFIRAAMYYSVVSSVIGIIVMMFVSWYFSVPEVNLNAMAAPKIRSNKGTGGRLSGRQRSNSEIQSRTISLKDLRGGVKMENEAARMKLLEMMLIGGDTGFKVTTLVLAGITTFMLVILLGNFMTWDSMFTTAIGKVVDATMTQIDIEAKFNLQRTLDETREISSLVRVAQSSGYLTLGPFTTEAENVRNDKFYSDLHHLYRTHLKPSMIYAATQDSKGANPYFRGVSRGHDFAGIYGANALGRVNQFGVTGAIQTTPLRAVKATSHPGFAANVSVDITQTKQFYYTLPPGKADPRDEGWWSSLRKSAAAAAKPFAYSQWSLAHDMGGKAGLGITTLLPVTDMTGYPSAGDRPTPSVPASSAVMVDIGMDTISDTLNKIVFFPADSPAAPSGVVFVVDRTNGVVLASSERPVPGGQGEAGEEIMVRPSQGLAAKDAKDPFIQYAFNQLEMRRGNVGLMGKATKIERFETSKLPDDPSKKFKVILSRLGNPSSCIPVKGGSVDWLLVVALDRGIFFADYAKRSELSLIIALLSIIMSITFSVIGLRATLKTYEEKGAATVDHHMESRAQECRDMDPDSEEFFATFKALLTPSIEKANLILRCTGETELKPPLSATPLFERLYNMLRQNPDLFSKADSDKNGTLTMVEFKKFVMSIPGNTATACDIEVVFRTLDEDGTGTLELHEFTKQLAHPTAQDKISTIDERQRALDYILRCEAGYSILELLGYEASKQTTKRNVYLLYGSSWYNFLIKLVLFAHLGISFMEAPSGRVALRPFEFFGSSWTRPDAAESVKATAMDIDQQLDAILVVSIVLIVLQFLDMAIGVTLYGIFKPGSSHEHDTHEVGYKPASACALFWEKVFAGQVRTSLTMHAVLLLVVLTDWILQATTRYQINGQNTVNGTQVAANPDSVLLFAYTAMLRPFIFMLRFEAVGAAGTSLVKTLFFGMDVIALFLSLVVICTTMGVALLNEGYGEGGIFSSVPQAIIAVYIFLLTGENHPDIVYSPTDCNSADESAPAMNSLLGGVQSGGCVNWGHHPMFIFFEFMGLFMIVALVIAVFESFYGNRTRNAAVEKRKKRRLGIIAAFVLLDKSGDGALDKSELLDFLNDTAGLDFNFEIADDLELNGIEFVEVAEHVVPQMKKIKEIHPGLIRLPVSTNSPKVTEADFLAVSKPTRHHSKPQKAKRLSVMSFMMHGGSLPSGGPTLTKGAIVDHAEAGTIMKFLKSKDNEMTPAPDHISHDTLPYYKRYAAAILRKDADLLRKSLEASVFNANKIDLRALLSKYFSNYQSFHQTAMMLCCFINIWVLTLYVHASGHCNVAGGNLTSTGGNTSYVDHGHDLGYKIDGCTIDIICIMFNVVWWLEVMARIKAVSWSNFWLVNDDFYLQLQNRFDFCLAVCSVVLNIVGGILYLTGNAGGERDPGITRLGFCFQAMRLLSVTALTREILFSMLAIIPSYTNVFLLLLLVVHFYNIIGCKCIMPNVVCARALKTTYLKYLQCDYVSLPTFVLRTCLCVPARPWFAHIHLRLLTRYAGLCLLASLPRCTPYLQA